VDFLPLLDQQNRRYCRRCERATRTVKGEGRGYELSAKVNAAITDEGAHMDRSSVAGHGRKTEQKAVFLFNEHLK
jgi:hypothetical protein